MEDTMTVKEVYEAVRIYREDIKARRQFKKAISAINKEIRKAMLNEELNKKYPIQKGL